MAFSLLKLGHVFQEDADPATMVQQAANRHGFPEHVALAVALVESSLNPHSISSVGAMGLMQLMPKTAAALDVNDPFDPAENADGGVRYLKQMWRRYNGNQRRALAAYNAGPGRIPRSGPLKLSVETRRYISRVLTKAAKYRRQ